MIQIEGSYNIDDLQRIVVHKRRGNDYRNRWNGVDYMKFLDSTGNVIKQIDQRSVEFDHVDYVNFIGKDDENLSSELKRYGIKLYLYPTDKDISGEPQTTTKDGEIYLMLDDLSIRNYDEYYLYSVEGERYFDMKHINTENVTNMESLFLNQQNFNKDISGWDVSNVTNMSNMFKGATKFNQSLDNWNVSSVENMSSMLFNATSFNQSLDNWNVSSVENMNNMFRGATSFNKSLNNWNVSNLKTTHAMFMGSNFNQPLNNWNVSSIENMSSMFQSNTIFNQNINGWNVSNVENMNSIFRGAGSFNQPLNNWDVSSVKYISGMFWGADSFNQPLNNWDVSSVENFTIMFKNATSFVQDIRMWSVSDTLFASDPSNQTELENSGVFDMFQGATSFQNKYNVTDTPPIELFTETDEFKFLWFTGEYAKLQVHEVECYINNINKAINSENGLAYFTTTDYLVRETKGFNHNEREYHNASFKANDGFFNNRAQTWIDEYPDYRNLLIELADKSAINDLQRIVVYKRRDAGFEDRWNTINFVQLLNSKGNIVAEIDQTPKTFDEFLYINYIGEDDNNLSSDIKLVGNDVRDMYFDPAKQETADQEALQKIEAQEAEQAAAEQAEAEQAEADQEAADQEAIDQAQQEAIDQAIAEQEAQLENVTVVDQESDVTVINSNGNKYRLNGDTTYDQNMQYGLYNGVYVLKNVPQDHPLAIEDFSGHITYFGDETKKLTKL